MLPQPQQWSEASITGPGWLCGHSPEEAQASEQRQELTVQTGLGPQQPRGQGREQQGSLPSLATGAAVAASALEEQVCGENRSFGEPKESLQGWGIHSS